MGEAILKRLSFWGCLVLHSVPVAASYASSLRLIRSLFRFDDAAPDPFRDLWDDGVSESSKAVHPSGYPMSHSTHVGFSAPFSSASDKILRSCFRDPLPPHLQNAAPPVSVTAVGVGHSRAAPVSVSQARSPFCW